MIPSWYQSMLEELGQKEIAGPGNNPRILIYQTASGFNGRDDEVPWCGSFLGWAMRQNKIPYKFETAARALSWLDDPNFKRLKAPILGAIGVSKRQGGGHVFVFSKWIDKEKGRIQVLNGNVNNRVEFSERDNSTTIAWLWPKSVPIPMAATPMPKSSVNIGGATAGAGGVLVAAQGIEKLVTQENVDAVSTATAQAQERISAGTWLGIGVGIIIIAAAIFIIWRRYKGSVDEQKMAGQHESQLGQEA